MPYTICVNMPGCLPEQDPVAAATIEEARDIAATEVECSSTWIGSEYTMSDFTALARAAGTLPEQGGIIGPLPDGYVIDVQPIEWGVLIDAYNAA